MIGLVELYFGDVFWFFIGDGVYVIFVEICVMDVVVDC